MAGRNRRGLILFLGILVLALAVIAVVLVRGGGSPIELTTRAHASTSQEAVPTSEESPGVSSPWAGLWRTEGEDAVELLALNEDGSFSLALHFYGSGGHIYRQFGWHHLKGRELLLYEIIDDEGDACDNMRFDYQLHGDVMTLDGNAIYDRVAEGDKAAVLDDPYKAYP